MKLSKYLQDLFQKNDYGHNKPLKCDIVNCETGEVYFTGSIEFLWRDLISDKLQFVSHDQQNTIWFKEVRE